VVDDRPTYPIDRAVGVAVELEVLDHAEAERRHGSSLPLLSFNVGRTRGGLTVV
jgi:hypothetical protein